MSLSTIAVLTATRGRPEKLKRMLHSLGATVHDKSRVSHWICIDEDDEATLEFIKFVDLEKLTGYPVHVVVGKKPRKLPDVWNAVWQVAKDQADIFIGFTDDYEMHTHGWDELLREGVNLYPDGVAVVHIPDPFAPEIITVICATAKVFNALGYFSIPYFPFWFADGWIDEISKMIQRRVTIEINMGPQGGDRGKTMNMHNLAFWFDFFCQLRDERREEAERIRRLIANPDSVEYSVSKLREEEFIHNQVNRDYWITPEKLAEMQFHLSGERGPPSANYLAIEAEAREHLRMRLALKDQPSASD